MTDDEVRESWNRKASEWHAHVGRDGDSNRRLNSDPVLWRMLGDVRGLRVLDAGCGTGYLTAQLARSGARVVAIDIAPAMIEIARANVADVGGQVDVRLDDGQTLATVADASIDRVVSNYVLMDLPDHEAALRAIARVLVPGGWAVAVFLHPCFDVPDGPERTGTGIRYAWPRPYADRWGFRCTWGPFSSDFIAFHRPLADWWRAIRAAGLVVDDFDEPMVAIDRADVPAEEIAKARWTSWSVAFRLRRP